MSVREKPVLLDGPSGQLEALYLEQADARGVVVVCHPNPAQGGSMLNKVVSTLQRTARDAGYSTLRFNYRGVGASAGTYSLLGGEVDDGEAVADWLLAQQPGLPLLLLGFSFGGFVAASLAARLSARGVAVSQLFMVAPAVTRLAADVSLPAAMRLTIIQPEQDEVLDPQQVYAWSTSLEHAHELLKVAECGHFFHGKLLELKELVLPRL